MDVEQALEAGLKKHAEELDRISKLPDLFQQGYQAAPIICEIGDCNAWELLNATLVGYAPPDQPENVQRDNGIIQWCNDQIKLGEES